MKWDFASVYARRSFRWADASPALEFRIPIAIIVVVAKPVPKADMSIPPVGVGTLDEMDVMATRPLAHRRK
jgi:hypothetical protein